MCSEKPLARNVSEAEEMLRLVKKSRTLDGYLENQALVPSLLKGKDIVWKRGAKHSGRLYLAGAAEEHRGPNEPWFWKGRESGGGVLLDMM